jgi:hypothetical protein
MSTNKCISFNKLIKNIMPKRGRPKVAKAKFKGVYIGARFSPDEAKQVEANVKKSKKAKSKWIRERLLKD